MDIELTKPTHDLEFKELISCVPENAIPFFDSDSLPSAPIIPRRGQVLLFAFKHHHLSTTTPYSY